MTKNYFEIIRAGINTTFQDQGRNNLYHIGIPFSGAMDKRNYLLSNKLVGNKLDSPVSSLIVRPLFSIICMSSDGFINFSYSFLCILFLQTEYLLEYQLKLVQVFQLLQL